jgi:hypothetical protein
MEFEKEFEMKSRAITLGASVIALTLAGPGHAAASVVGDLGQKLPDGSVAPKVEANVKVNVKANVKGTPVAPTKVSLEGDARGSDHPRTTVEAKRRSGGDSSHVVLDSNSRHGLSAYADQRRKGKFELEGEAHAGPRHAESTVTAFARHGGKAAAHGRAHTGKAKQIRPERTIRKQSRLVAGKDLPRSPKHERHLTPLQAMGREVGNPTQLSLAGWLIGLTGAGCLGVSRLARRLGRTS